MVEKIEYSKSRLSVIVIAIGFLTIYLLKSVEFLLYLSIVITFSAIVSKIAADKIHFVWMKLAWILSLIFPPILLGLIYYLFLSPIALLYRILGNKDLLQLKNSKPTTFIERKKIFEKLDFEKTW
ncbi:MAG: hypothetical protein JKY48_19395 [Flavobacteriales bacterium]|nr:hypothetical protein [Flavobacteriales bacterium]